MDCSVGGCDATGYCKGFCRLHYYRWRKHGDPLYVGKPGPPRRYCTIPGCSAGQVRYEMCDKHRKRFERHGDPMATSRVVGDDEARWWSHVDRRGDDECWPWTGFIDENGSARFWDGGSVTYAPRWGYERFVGPIPHKWVPDHTCHDPDVCRLGDDCPHRSCCNYNHLEPVTNRENVLRGASTKLADEEAAALLVRWRSGVSITALAVEIGMDKAALRRRLLRLEDIPLTG